MTDNEKRAVIALSPVAQRALSEKAFAAERKLAVIRLIDVAANRCVPVGISGGCRDTTSNLDIRLFQRLHAAAIHPHSVFVRGD